MTRGLPPKPVVSPGAEPDDVSLMARVAAGDAVAFALLHARYAPRVLGLIVSVLRDASESEDVLQQVMLEVWQRHAARYQPALGPVDGWLLRLARSRAIDRVRSLERGRLTPEEARGVIASRSSTAELGVGAAGQIEPRGGRASTTGLDAAMALESLPDDERVPIRLAFLGGCSREQIAAHVGVPVGTVKTRIRRGLGRLREVITGEANA